MNNLASLYERQREDAQKARFSPAEAYAKSLRDAVRGLWQGRFDRNAFGQAMLSAFERHLELAWREGAARCGIMPEERSPAEQAALNQFIDGQMAYVPDFGRFIEQNSKENGGLLRLSLRRVPLWTNRFNEVKELAQEMACQDQKLVWRLGNTIEHCKTCLKLNGRVMRASRWRELDVHPQDTRPGKLACNGYNCDCRRDPTNARATPGRLPRLP